MYKHETPVSCILLSCPLLDLYKAFEFLCRNQTRDENLLRSLQCLHDNRLPTMLDYHIAADCRHGMDILQQQMLARKRQQLYLLNSQVVGSFTTLYCLPESVLSECVCNLVDKYCGSKSAQLFLAYVQFQRDETKSAFEFLGLSSGFCLKNTSHDIQCRMSTEADIAKPPSYGRQTVETGSSSKAVFDTLLDIIRLTLN